MAATYGEGLLRKREDIHCSHFMGYSFQLTVRNVLYTPSHRHDSTYHGLCDTSCRALAETRNSSMDRSDNPPTRSPNVCLLSI